MKKLIKLLLFFCIVTGNGLFAMDLDPDPLFYDEEGKLIKTKRSEKQLPKPDLTEEQLKKERAQLRPKTFSKEAKKAAQTTDVQKIIAQEVVKPALKSITQQGILGFVLNEAVLMSPVVLSSDGTKVMAYVRTFKYPVQNYLKIWNVQRGQLLRTFKLSQGFVFKDFARFTQDGSKVIVKDGSSLKIWGLKKKISSIMKLSSMHPASLSADGNKVALYQNGDIKIVDFNTGKTIRVFSLEDMLNMMDDVLLDEDFFVLSPDLFVLSPDGNYLAVSFGENAGLFDVNNGSLIKHVKIQTFEQQFFSMKSTVVFGPKGKYVLFYNPNHSVNFFDAVAIWNVNMNKITSIKLEKKLDPISTRAQFSLDGSKVLIAVAKRVMVVDTQTGKPVFTHDVQNYNEQDIENALIMPNGNQIIFVEKDKDATFVKIFDIKTGKLILSHHIPAGAHRPKIYGKAIDWLQRSLLPDQAEIIRKMYEAHQQGKKFTINMADAVRFSKMPKYVKDMLKSYFEPLIQKEAELKNIPQQQEFTPEEQKLQKIREARAKHFAKQEKQKEKK